MVNDNSDNQRIKNENIIKNHLAKLIEEKSPEEARDDILELLTPSQEYSFEENKKIVLLEKEIITKLEARYNSEGKSLWKMIKKNDEGYKKSYFSNANKAQAIQLLNEYVRVFKNEYSTNSNVKMVEEYYNSIYNEKKLTAKNVKTYGNASIKEIAIATGFTLMFVASVAAIKFGGNKMLNEYKVYKPQVEHPMEEETRELPGAIIDYINSVPEEKREEARQWYEENYWDVKENEAAKEEHYSSANTVNTSTISLKENNVSTSDEEKQGKIYDCNLSAELQSFAFELTQEYGVDFNILMSIIHQESGGQFNTSGVASSGGVALDEFNVDNFESRYNEDKYFADFGLCQINSANFPSFCEVLGVTPDQIINDDKVNLRCAILQLNNIQVTLGCLNEEQPSKEEIFGMYNGWYGWEDKPYAVRYSEQASEHYNEIYNKDFTKYMDVSSTIEAKTR